MITHIYISNYALIKELTLDLTDGFTTITGETGAGKSILLGALGLVLGKRADKKVIVDDSKKCVVEAHFRIGALNLQEFFTSNELDFEEECIVRREISPSGKSRSFINDTPVKLDVLKSFGARLVDIHSQHDSILMLDTSYQLKMLDTIAQNKNELDNYTQEYFRYKSLLEEREKLRVELQQQLDLDYLSFLHEELEKAKFNAGEEKSIESELQVLRHAEDIQRGLSAGLGALNEEQAALDQLTHAIRSIENISGFLPESAVLLERLRSAEIELRDIVGELEGKAEETFVDETKLQELEDRFNLINHLLQKHRVASTEELIEKEAEISNQLLLANNSEHALKKLDEEISEHFKKLKECGKVLHHSRIKTAKVLEKDAQRYLERLNLKGALLKIDIQLTEKSTQNGFDDINFYFSANVGSKPSLIKKVASGGELSRVMLVLKAILAKTKSLPAIIFDEIDSGISGETAHRVADVLTEMGKEMQVLAITHLPQIAARGKEHLLVLKESSATETTTHISRLLPNQRVEEVARLLSGEQISESAKKTAEELLS